MTYVAAERGAGGGGETADPRAGDADTLQESSGFRVEGPGFRAWGRVRDTFGQGRVQPKKATSHLWGHRNHHSSGMGAATDHAGLLGLESVLDTAEGVLFTGGVCRSQCSVCWDAGCQVVCYECCTKSRTNKSTYD